MTEVMTTARDDLKEVNAALRELVRLQLSGELLAQEAWQARRQMLDSVEAAWHDLSQDLTPEALASKQRLKKPVQPQLSLQKRLRQLPKLQLPQLQLASWRLPRLSSLRLQALFRAFKHLPWWSLFMMGALATFYYISTL